MTIHILKEGWSLCRRCPDIRESNSRSWVGDDRWVFANDEKNLNKVDCPSCILTFLDRKVPDAPKTPEHDKVTASNDLPQKLCEFVKEFLPEHGITLGERHHHNEFCEDEEGDQVCGLREGALLPCNKDIVSFAAEFIGVDRKKYDKEKDAALAHIREIHALHDWSLTEGRRLIAHGRYP